MRHLTLLLAMALLAGRVSGQGFEWARSAGGVGVDVGRCVQAMPDGGATVGGSFGGSMLIEGQWVTGRGLTDGLVARYSTDGTLLWVRSLGGPKDDAVRGITSDPEGNVYVCGTFTDTIIFNISDSDTVAFGSIGGIDMFAASYGPDGTFRWATTAGGTGEDMANDIVRHPDGSLYMTGGFEDRCYFRPQGTLFSNGGRDMFMARLMATDGGQIGLAKGGGLAHDVGTAIDVATDWGVYVAGDFYEEVIFGEAHFASAGSSDMFLCKYHQVNQLQWVRTAGGTASDVATGLATDLNGHAYVCGYFLGTTQFPCGNITAVGYNDVFVARFTDQGQCDWVKGLGGGALDNALGMDVTWDGNIYITGLFDSELIIDQDTLTGNGYDVFLTHLDAEGDHRYTVVAGAGSADIGQAVSVGANDELFTTGYYFYFADFGTHTIGIADNGDLYLAKLSHILGQSNQMTTENGITVYPNPTTGIVNLRSDQPIDEAMVFDGQGRIVHRNSHLGPETSIDMGRLSNGLYTLRAMRADGSLSTIRIVLQQ
jgi:hypothetical protein